MKTELGLVKTDGPFKIRRCSRPSQIVRDIDSKALAPPVIWQPVNGKLKAVIQQATSFFIGFC
jgi:hypothetical protein